MCIKYPPRATDTMRVANEYLKLGVTDTMSVENKLYYECALIPNIAIIFSYIKSLCSLISKFSEMVLIRGYRCL